MARFIALLDANVLYPITVTNLVLEAAVAGLFQPRWSEDIEREWVTHLKADNPHDAAGIDRRRLSMNHAFPNAFIDSNAYQPLIAGLNLPDPDDAHVLAAAISCRADVIVTYNLRDFLDADLAPYGVEAQHPDVFLVHQMTLRPGAFVGAAAAVRARLAAPPFTVAQYLDSLREVELMALADELQQYAASL